MLSVEKDEHPKRACERVSAAHPQAHLCLRTNITSAYCPCEKKEKGDPPPSVQRACQIERGSWQGVPCYTVRPFHGKGANGHVLYLHGGGYVFETVPAHWQLLSTLINRSDVTATVPLYPLAPEHTSRDTYP